MNAAARPVPLSAVGTPARRKGTTAYRWMRQLHLWVGAWGAIAAVLYGFTGLVMNNRFGDNAWPQGKSEESGRLVIEVPTSAGASPEALATWLREARGLDARVVRKGKPSEGRLAGRAVVEPAKWNLSGGTGGSSWSLEYVPGNATAEVKRSSHSPLAVVTRLHKGVGGGWAWNLLADSFAIGMVLLGLSGIWMWARGRTAKQMLLSVLGLSGAVLAVVLGAAFG
ncbi:PepSY-associated TM helix domain-containing protein [Lysobacter korlensis]|uniref:PepSY-associated TM helix domain-containing protein n=1 Tax=Lysobacter korlensis TaxID=553636 RepID=A0ABV6RSF0_9GAMM